MSEYQPFIKEYIKTVNRAPQKAQSAPTFDTAPTYGSAEFDFSSFISNTPVVDKDKTEEHLQELGATYAELGLQPGDIRSIVGQHAHNFYNGNLEGQVKASQEIVRTLSDIHRRRYDAAIHPFYKENPLRPTANSGD